MDEDDARADRQRRREARAEWPGEVHRDGTHPAVDTSQMSVTERLAAQWKATVDAWLLSGRELPNLPRSEWPGRVIRQQ